jgi:hypothetical protein
MSVLWVSGWLLAYAIAASAADAPLRVASYDGDSGRLVDDLRAATVNHLLVLSSRQPPDSLGKALQSAGIEIVRSAPRQLRQLRDTPEAAPP